MPAVFYSFAASRPRFLARNLRNSLGAPGDSHSGMPPAALGQFSLAVLLGRCYEPAKVPLARFFPVYRHTATKKPKNAHEENRGNYQTFQTR
jgi:hypothetical protein